MVEIRYEKVVRGWTLIDSILLIFWILLDIFCIYWVLFYNPYFIFVFIVSFIATISGSIVFLDREVYWRKINGKQKT